MAASYEDGAGGHDSMDQGHGTNSIVESNANNSIMGAGTSSRRKQRERNSQSQQPGADGKTRNLKAVSNIHQLYQDLFITDMKDEIAVASNEVVLLR